MRRKRGAASTLVRGCLWTTPNDRPGNAPSTAIPYGRDLEAVPTCGFNCVAALSRERTHCAHRMTRRLGATVHLISILAACPYVAASAQSLDIRQYSHTAWTVQDGAPGAVRNLAQGADGVLWIASEQGLFQFDGVRFERFEPPPGQALLPRGVLALLPLPDTSLWIGHFTSGVSVVHGRKIVT